MQPDAPWNSLLLLGKLFREDTSQSVLKLPICAVYIPPLCSPARAWTLLHRSNRALRSASKGWPRTTSQGTD